MHTALALYLKFTPALHFFIQKPHMLLKPSRYRSQFYPHVRAFGFGLDPLISFPLKRLQRFLKTKRLLSTIHAKAWKHKRPTFKPLWRSRVKCLCIVTSVPSPDPGDEMVQPPCAMLCGYFNNRLDKICGSKRNTTPNQLSSMLISSAISIASALWFAPGMAGSKMLGPKLTQKEKKKTGQVKKQQRPLRTNCLQPESNWRSFACQANGLTNFPMKTTMAFTTLWYQKSRPPRYL